MQTIFTTLLLTALFVSQTQAQYCGASNPSGPGQCTPVSGLPNGVSPVSDSLAPFINGATSSATLQVKFDTIYFGGQHVAVQSLKIDTLDNLPDGLCWSTNAANNTFPGIGGCIQISGTPCAPPGQYKLRMIITAVLANALIPIQTNADAAGLHYYWRVNNSGDADVPVDTTQTSANPFISYGSAAAGCVPTGNCQALYTLVRDTNATQTWWGVNLSVVSGPATYQWGWGDGTGSTGATPSHTYSAPGNYNICLSVTTAGCVDSYCDSSTYIYKTDGMVTVNIVDHLPTGITNLAPAALNFTLFPNPSSSSVTITADPSLVGSVATVTDVAGRRVAAVQLQTINNKLETINLSNGLYFITIGKATRKLVISK